MRSAVVFTVVLLLAACDTQIVSENPSPDVLIGPQREAAGNGVTVRPIEDFLATNSGGCYFYWYEQSDKASNGRRVWLDYGGFFKNAIANATGGAIVLPTTYEGQVTERALKDGSAELHVTLHARDMLVWADAGVPGAYAPLFGYSWTDVAGGAPASLADLQFSLDYVNPAGPGAPIQNLCAVAGDYRAHVVINGDGDLRAGFDGASDGDPGRISVNQRGVVSKGKGNGVADGYPVEFVKIQATGH